MGCRLKLPSLFAAGRRFVIIVWEADSSFK